MLLYRKVCDNLGEFRGTHHFYCDDSGDLLYYSNNAGG